MSSHNLPKAQLGAAWKAGVTAYKAGRALKKTEKAAKTLADLKKVKSAKAAATRQANKQKKAAENFYEGLGARGTRPAQIVKKGDAKELKEVKVTATRTKADAKKGRQAQKTQKKTEKAQAKSQKANAKAQPEKSSRTSKVVKTGVILGTLGAMGSGIYNEATANRNEVLKNAPRPIEEKPNKTVKNTNTNVGKALRNLDRFKKYGGAKTGSSKYPKMTSKQTKSAGSAMKSMGTSKAMIRPSIKKR